MIFDGILVASSFRFQNEKNMKIVSREPKALKRGEKMKTVWRKESFGQ